MARKSPKTESKAAEPAPASEQPKAPEPEQTEQQAKRAEKKANARTSNGYVDAKLKARHCSGGRCKEAGQVMRMTRSEYERLKKHGGVE